LPGTRLEGVRALAEKIRSEVEALQVPHASSSTGQYVTISIGGASVIPTADSPMTSLIQAADLALYKAKRGGKNQVTLTGD
jgi:two-component system chemotaxis family response regulator WspR